MKRFGSYPKTLAHPPTLLPSCSPSAARFALQQRSHTALPNAPLLHSSRNSSASKTSTGT